jgi:ATP-dependent RNA helicase DDX3X
MPTNIDDYIHRIGRTGRCGNKGSAVSFISEKSKPVMKDLYKLLKRQNQNIPEWLEEFARRADYDKGCNYNLI